MGSCLETDPNFNDSNSVFKVLSKIEEENNKLRFHADKNIDNPNLAKKCIQKTEMILKFLKNKPLYYLDERLSKFKLILNRFYLFTIRYDLDNYLKAEEELQEFIFNMMDFYNGIRNSVVNQRNSNNNVNELNIDKKLSSEDTFNKQEVEVLTFRQKYSDEEENQDTIENGNHKAVTDSYNKTNYEEEHFRTD